MKKDKIEKEKNKCLNNLYKAVDMSEKLMWQNVYFWWIKNEDTLQKGQL